MTEWSKAIADRSLVRYCAAMAAQNALRASGADGMDGRGDTQEQAALRAASSAAWKLWQERGGT